MNIVGASLIVPGLRSGLSSVRSSATHFQLPVSHEPCGSYDWPVARVPMEMLEDVAAHPRLRRAGKVSLLAAAAAKDALADAGLEPNANPHLPAVFVTSDGGVSYTSRFFGDVARQGTGSGSPLLFPETVYNAPASHVANLLGSSAEFLTLVGDASAAIAAIAQASLLLSSHCPYVLVLAANECDPLASAGYSRWGFLTSPLSSHGHILSDGAAALLLSHQPSRSSPRIEAALCGQRFRSKEGLTAHLAALLSQITASPAPLFIPACQNTAFEAEEAAACPKNCRSPIPSDFKACFGESLAASPLVATVAWLGGFFSEEKDGAAVVSGVGFSGGVAVLHLTNPEA